MNVFNWLSYASLWATLGLLWFVLGVGTLLVLLDALRKGRVD